jgi:signal transduction histidine kinase
VAIFADREAADVGEVVRLLVLVSFGTLVVGGALAWVVAGRVLAPVREVRDTARAITDTDLGARIPVADDASEDDDLAQLARTFNEMLDRLERAFSSQREFVDDAGHELRTPLTVVRGHLETLDASDTAQVAAVRTLVLDETERMARLVADLQTLTKAGRPDFLRREDVDLVALLDDLLVKSSALADRRWELGTVPEAVVRVDRHRVTQAVLALADNAAKNTATSDRIEFGASIDRHDLRVWVDDSGPGIPGPDRALVMRRFAHEPRSSGSGLGLSIVEAIAVAHGGRVDIGDAPLGGARVALVLPGVVTRSPDGDGSKVVRS